MRYRIIHPGDLDGLRATLVADRVLMVVYHKGHRVEVRRFGAGFPPTPMTCSRCLECVDDDDLRYSWATLR